MCYLMFVEIMEEDCNEFKNLRRYDTIKCRTNTDDER